MDTLDYIQGRFNLNLRQRQQPIEIPNFGRDNLATMLAELSFGVGVEVGVAHGEYSETLAKANPQMQLTGVDPYEPHTGYRDYTSHTTFNTLKQDAHNRLDKYDNYTFMEAYSMDAVKQFDDNSLDFVYIDADHQLVTVINDVHEWLKKVRPGGILAGHDYAHTSGAAMMHVKSALPVYCACYGIKPWFVLGNEANNEGLIRDQPRSWMIVK